MPIRERLPLPTALALATMTACSHAPARVPVTRDEGAGHFDPVAPFTPGWRRAEEAVRSPLGAP